MNARMIMINNQEYPLSTTLRVAYKIQGFNNHKSYLEVFKDVEHMTVEKQIDILYASFSCANPGIMSQLDFQNYCLDNFNLKDLMTHLQSIITGILGEDKTQESQKETTEAEAEASTGNF